MSIISNTIVLFQNKRYEELYKNEENLKLVGIVISNKEEKEYKDVYKLKIKGKENNKKYNNTHVYIQIDKKKNSNLQYGDKIYIEGKYIKPTEKRNYGGFDYSNYLKTLKIYGNIKVEKFNIIDKNKANLILTFANKISLSIKEKISKLMNETTASIFQGLILGDTSKIEKEVQENFRTSNISHILAISGMHISYIMIGINILLKNRFGKRKTRFIIIIFLILYVFITGFSPSVIRAVIMGSLVTFAGIIYRKNDIWTSISASLLLILIYNPFLIMNIGLQFSYLGTIGIIIFHKNVYKFLRNIKIKDKKIRYKINRKMILVIDKIKEILAVTLSAGLAILPITIYHFNIFGIYFFISNILVSLIIGPIIIIGCICVIFSFIYFPLSKFISFILVTGIETLIQISNISKLPFSKIYIPTPKISFIIIYYIFIILTNYIYSISNSKKISNTQMRVKNLIALLKYKFKQKRKRNLILVFIMLILLYLINFIPQNLKIHFIDVGQGDSTFLITPYGKTILIDGGGSLSESFDVGKSTLLPYILDRGYTKIDYIFISHFDQDHVAGLLTFMKELKVKNIITGKQFEDSENYQKFLKIVKENKIIVHVVEAGQKIKIEKGIYFDVLWPSSNNVISKNSINNNSLVCKMIYKDFSILFTGDIEEIAEQAILKKHKGTNILQSTILKVAHHGSKSSSIKVFLDEVKPKIALIGVGENNTFGHPDDNVLKRIERLWK